MANTKLGRLAPSAILAMETLAAAGFEAYLVGGAVRDMVMGRQPNDIDIATNALPGQVENLLKGNGRHSAGIKYGTVLGIFNGEEVQITTFRSEEGYEAYRRPLSVAFGVSLEDDLSRRDFTMNAMAADTKGALIDPFGGLKDIEARLVRCVGDPSKRFSEDALRILRAVRFASQLGFSIEPETLEAANCNKGLLAHISSERIKAEIEKMLLADPVKALINHNQIIMSVLPELLPIVDAPQNNPHHLYGVFEHTAVAISHCRACPIERWAALFHDAGKPGAATVDEEGIQHFEGHEAISVEIAQTILSRLKFSNKEASRILLLVKHHDDTIPPNLPGVKRWLSKIGQEAFWQLMSLKRADNLAQNYSCFPRDDEYSAIEQIASQVISGSECTTLSQLSVSGNDLINIGINQGPGLGKVLGELLSMVIDGDAQNEKEDLLRHASRLANSN
ncbi:MAG: HD domain-containing protein [Eubacteriaceae bacterium]|nr:HD domain-containing protein [Eubacteriaceae bacterium]